MAHRRAEPDSQFTTMERLRNESLIGLELKRPHAEVALRAWWDDLREGCADSSSAARPGGDPPGKGNTWLILRQKPRMLPAARARIENDPVPPLGIVDLFAVPHFASIYLRLSLTGAPPRPAHDFVVDLATPANLRDA